MKIELHEYDINIDKITKIVQHIVKLLNDYKITYMDKEYIYIDIYDDEHITRKYQISIQEIIE